MIREEENVILKKGNVLKAFKVRKGRRVWFDRLHFTLDDAIGCPLGSMFEVSGDKLKKVELHEDIDELLLAKGNIGDKSNQFLQSDGTSQRLSKDDIMGLKAQGASGQDIIDHLVENSTTFKERTEFSQAKYKNKKKNKYITRFSILRPTTDLIAQVSYLKGSSRTCEVRLDTLSQILTMANVRAHVRMAIVESCQGLIVGALLERMGGYGRLIQIYSGDFPGRQTLDLFNFPKTFMDCLYGFPMSKVTSLGKSAGIAKPSTTTETSETVPGGVPVERPTNENGCSEEDASNCMLSEDKIARRERRKNEETKATEELEAGNLDGLVVASRFQPSPLMTSLLPLLAPSRPFVVYCQYKEPLMECYVNLREQGTAININLSETWWRHYQVLPARTHPEITMDSTGGYLLSGITVDPRNPQRDLEQATKKVKLDECG